MRAVLWISASEDTSGSGHTVPGHFKYPGISAYIPRSTLPLRLVQAVVEQLCNPTHGGAHPPGTDV